MKKLIFRSVCFVLLGTSYAVSAQEANTESEKKSPEVTKYTVMERFEPRLMPSAEERLKFKEVRVAEINRRREILDTLDISERKREKLLSDLLKDPFSTRLSRTLAEIEFEEDKK